MKGPEFDYAFLLVLSFHLYLRYSSPVKMDQAGANGKEPGLTSADRLKLHGLEKLHRLSLAAYLDRTLAPVKSPSIAGGREQCWLISVTSRSSSHFTQFSPYCCEFRYIFRVFVDNYNMFLIGNASRKKLLSPHHTGTDTLVSRQRQ